jgi:hypothetical protein
MTMGKVVEKKVVLWRKEVEKFEETLAGQLREENQVGIKVTNEVNYISVSCVLPFQ